MIEYIVVAGVGIFLLLGLRSVRPTHRALIERFGKYKRFKNAGLTWIFPAVEKMYTVNITEQMIDAEPQEIITKDSLNAKVDAQVYFKVISTEDGVKASQYNVNNYKWQIVNLARTTLRNIIGTMNLKTANSERNTINDELMKVLKVETSNWGIEVVRTELKEIQPPEDVQETMNKVVKAENEKIAAVDFATAVETRADGEKRGKIKEAEGFRQSEILMAEGKAQAIKLVNDAADATFKGNAQLMKQFEVTQASLEGNAKIVLTEKGISPVIVFGEGSTPLPIPIKKK
jgi:regulator of protease activity HflC (stomatin/prohibitin superfamily)